MLRIFLVLVLSTGIVFAEQADNSLKIVSTNFENLFDAKHDEGKIDFTYLPLSVKTANPDAMAYCNSLTGFYKEECLTLDWTQARVDRKIKRIAQVLTGMWAPGLPDIIAVQEVENIGVLSKVAKAIGPDFKAVLIEGPDERGIDTAIITRLPIISSKLHNFETSSGRLTRGILEVNLRAGTKRVTVFVNHWPSQSNPDEDRMLAGQLLVKIATVAQKKSDLVIASGDFNTAADDTMNALETLINPLFFDAEDEAKKQGVKLGAAATYSFRGVWASLDHVYIMKNGRTKAPDFSKAFIYTENNKLIENYTYQGKPESRPLRYNIDTGAGYSDHLPFGLTLKL